MNRDLGNVTMERFLAADVFGFFVHQSRTRMIRVPREHQVLRRLPVRNAVCRPIAKRVQVRSAYEIPGARLRLKAPILRGSRIEARDSLVSIALQLIVLGLIDLPSA